MIAQKWYAFSRNLLWIVLFSQDSNVQYDTLLDGGQQQWTETSSQPRHHEGKQLMFYGVVWNAFSTYDGVIKT